MRLNLSLFQKALVLIAVPLAFQLVFVFSLVALRQQVEQEKTEQVHAREVYRHLDRMLRNVMDRSMESIIASVTKSMGVDDEEAESRLQTLTNNIHAESEAFKQFASGNEAEKKLFADCDALQDQMNASWDVSKRYLDRGDRLGALRSFTSTQMIARKLLKQCDLLSADEHTVEATQLQAEAKHRDQIELLIKCAVLFNIALAVALAFFFNIGTTRRLDVLMDNIVRLPANVPLNEPLAGDDELAKLDRTFHYMADALALANRQERAIIDKTMDVICSLNAAGKFTRVSPAASDVWGYSPADLLGRHQSDLIADRDKQRTMSAMKDIKAGLREEAIETQVIRSDGRAVDTMWSARWSQEDQTMFCVAHDITARKQTEKILQEAEARVRLIVESLPIGLLIIDRTGLIEFTNPCAAQMFGFSAIEIGGEHVAQLFRLNSAATVGAPAKAQPEEFNRELFLRAQNGTWELEGIKIGGTTFPAEVSLTEFSATTGQRFLVVIIDATQKHAVEQMRQEFIAMISHDLRSPLTSVQTFLDLLETGICGDLNEKGKKKLGSATRNVERLVDLIRDLLDLERFKSGILIVDPADVSLNSVIDRSVDAVKLQSEHLGIEIKVAVPDVQIRADAGRLSQAIVNLLSNALKFSPKGSAIDISGKTDGDWVELRVTDQGRGISQEDQARIFERFQQVKEEDEDFKRGTGLGLPICKAIIEQHGGSIGVESEKGKGSSFWLRLPLKPPGS
jgi:PAS domain S-box-containing protein